MAKGTSKGSVTRQVKKSDMKMPAKASGMEKVIQDVTNRYRVTAREARDIATAIGTHLNASSQAQAKKSNANLGKQIKEVGSALVSGKKGTTSDTASIKKVKNVPNKYKEGTQR